MELLATGVIEVAEVFFRPDRLDAEHGRLVGNRGNALFRRSSHSLCGTVWSPQLRKAFLDCDQLSLKFVIFGVGNDGCVEDIVEMVVSIDVAAQMYGAATGTLFAQPDKTASIVGGFARSLCRMPLGAGHNHLVSECKTIIATGKTSGTL